MDWKREWRWLVALTGAFAAAFYLPVGRARFDGAVLEGLHLLRWYAREHVLLCLVPALFIAGAISVFVSQSSVMKYLGAGAHRATAYGVASVSGTVLAVCSCTVLPLFAGIYRMGAGLGPAVAFLYAGPAINVLAIVLTARVLGLELGVARAVGAVAFSVLIGLLMQAVFRHEDRQRADAPMPSPAPQAGPTLGHQSVYFGAMVAFLIFATWARPDTPLGPWLAVFEWKWWLTSAAALVLGLALVRWFGLAWRRAVAVAAVTAVAAWAAPGAPLVPFATGLVAFSVVTSTAGGPMGEWFEATWGFAKQILPLLLAGVLAAGFLLGRPGHEGVVPSSWVATAVGGNSLGANLFASVVGALMYFATLTEVPIVQGLLGSGMGKGPALALLLSGPALSLPSMLVLGSVVGLRKTVVYVALVVVMSTVCGWGFGIVAG